MKKTITIAGNSYELNYVWKNDKPEATSLMKDGEDHLEKYQDYPEMQTAMSEIETEGKTPVDETAGAGDNPEGK